MTPTLQYIYGSVCLLQLDKQTKPINILLSLFFIDNQSPYTCEKTQKRNIHAAKIGREKLKIQCIY